MWCHWPTPRQQLEAVLAFLASKIRPCSWQSFATVVLAALSAMGAPVLPRKAMKAKDHFGFGRGLLTLTALQCRLQEPLRILCIGLGGGTVPQGSCHLDWLDSLFSSARQGLSTRRAYLTARSMSSNWNLLHPPQLEPKRVLAVLSSWPDVRWCTLLRRCGSQQAAHKRSNSTHPLTLMTQCRAWAFVNGRI